MTILHARQALTARGWADDVEIVIGGDGRIASLGPQTGAADHRVDLALPAPANLHSHAFQRAMAGLTETRGADGQDSFWTWRRLMYRFLDRLTPEDVEAIAAMVCVETAEAGFGALAEFHYLHHAPGGASYADPAETGRRIVAAAEQTGLGLTLLPVLYQRGGCDGRPLTGGQLRFGNDIDRFARLWEAAARAVDGAAADMVLGVAPHSLRAVDGDGLAAAEALRGRGPLHIHVAEQLAEVDEVVAHLGARPVEWLLANRPVDAGWCLIHCTRTTAAETRDLARSGAVAGLCPITEANLGDGIFNGTSFLAHGGGFGVGSDSNVQIALFDELRLLEYGQRLRDHSRAALARPDRSTGRVLFETAAAGGARAAGRPAGALAPGRLADIVGLATDTERLCGRRGDAALDTLIFAGAGPGAVTDLWSAGRHIVQGGRHVARDAVAARFRAALDRRADAL